MNIFEGYVGIRLWDEQLVDDVIFSLLLFLFVVFSFVFTIKCVSIISKSFTAISGTTVIYP